MGNNKKNAESPEDRDPMESFELTTPPESSGLETPERDEVEGTNPSELEVENSEQTESQQDAEKKVLGEKSRMSGQPLPKKKKFLIKVVTFCLIGALGSAVYFLIMERKQNLNKIQNQLARLDAQIQSLQTARKEPNPFFQNQQVLQTRLQELESKVKQLASQTLKDPTASIEETAIEKAPVEAEFPKFPDKTGSGGKTVSQEAPDSKPGKPSDATEHMDIPETESETAEEKLENVDLEELTSVAEVEFVGNIVEKKSTEAIEKMEEELSDGTTNDEAEQTAVIEEPSEAIQAPKTQENLDTRNEVETTKVEKPEMTIPLKIEPKPASATEAHQTLNPGAKRYVEFVEIMAGKAYQLAQKGFDVSLDFLREVAR